jgi:pimeloyl-ACP methyl ester carboxylesterase
MRSRISCNPIGLSVSTMFKHFRGVLKKGREKIKKIFDRDKSGSRPSSTTNPAPTTPAALLPSTTPAALLPPTTPAALLSPITPAALLAALLSATMTAPPSTTGTAPFSIQGYTFSTHYRIFGTIDNAHRPLVVLHGGPGIVSTYMEPFTELTSRFGITVVLYDQFGCGKSLPDPETPDRKVFDEISSKPGFWNVDLFVDELDNILNHLKINENFDLLGHSWGGMLAASYIIKMQPKGLKNLVFANSLSCMQDWVDSTMKLIISPTHRFPRKERNVIKFVENHPDAKSVMTPEEYEALENEGVDLKSEAYKNAIMLFRRTFLLRVDPWPEQWIQSLTAASLSPIPPVM